MNSLNYAELNPAINYNKPQPLNAKQNEYQDYEDELNFSKFQNNLSKTNNDCNENAKIASKHLFIESNDLTNLFYSKENIDRIQKQIRREIFVRTNGKFKVFKDSDELDIQIVMDDVFDNHAKNLPNKIVRQVKILNKHTVDKIVPNAITQIDQTSKYLKQLDQPIRPIDRPINANNGGRKTLPSFTTVLGF